MNIFVALIIGVPVIEIIVMIKIGGVIGAFNTAMLVILTAFVGVFFARLEGLNTLRSGFYNLYQNKVPIYEMLSGASIAIAAVMLIIPGFVTDAFGFILLVPFTRKLIIQMLFKRFQTLKEKDNINKEKILEGEIIDDNDKSEK
tara:strand:+ start:114 stop:545 length:432 start_codon:yes stop_codon:yes gene_type:complete